MHWLGLFLDMAKETTVLESILTALYSHHLHMYPILWHPIVHTYLYKMRYESINVSIVINFQLLCSPSHLPLLSPDQRWVQLMKWSPHNQKHAVPPEAPQNETSAQRMWVCQKVTFPSICTSSQAFRQWRCGNCIHKFIMAKSWIITWRHAWLHNVGKLEGSNSKNWCNEIF